MCRLTKTWLGTLGIEIPTHPCPAFCVPKNCCRLPHRSGFGHVGYGFGFCVWVRVLRPGYASSQATATQFLQRQSSRRTPRVAPPTRQAASSVSAPMGCTSAARAASALALPSSNHRRADTPGPRPLEFGPRPRRLDHDLRFGPRPCTC